MIDLIGTLRRLTASVLGIATDTTTIAVDVAGLDGDAMRGTDDAALASSWTAALATALANYTAVRAGYLDELDFDLQAALIVIAAYVDELETRLTALRAGYLDELGPTNLPSDVDDLISDAAILEHKWESRTRVYPQDTQVAIQLTTDIAADTFGVWAEVIPINIIDFTYRVLGVEIEETNRAGTFTIQFGFSTVDGSDPTTAQIAGERRIKLVGTPLKLEQASRDLYGGHIHENAKLWGRVKSSTGTVDILDISVIVTRCLQTSHPVAALTTWPWAT